MKNLWKIFGFTFLGIVLALYICFLFVLPNVIDLNQYKPIVKDLAKEQANLDINFENPKIITTPFLGVGIKAEDISIKLPDDSLLFSAESLKTRISVPSIFLLTLKVSCLEVEKPFVNLEIAKDNIDYKVVKLVEDILNENKEKTLGEENVEEEGWFNPAWIRIKVPAVKLHNYKVLVTDLNTKHYLDLHGDELIAGYFNGKRAKLKTYAELFSDSDKNITANIDISTFIPAHEPSLDSEDDPAERIDIPFVNPVTMYRNYNLKANLDTKLKVNTHKDGSITSFGHFNIDGITLKVSELNLPESYLKVKTFGSTLDMDTNVYAAKNQNIQLLGKLNYGKHPKMDMNIKTGEIKFNDMLILTRAFLDSLQISHELKQIKADGSLLADCYIKTNFKKLKSDGFIKIQNGGISVRNLGQVLSGANINILLNESVLTLKDSSLFVHKSKIYADGNIDKNSVADITIKTEKLPLQVLFNAFAPKNIREAYAFKSGNLSLNLMLKGKLKNLIGTANFGLDSFDLSDRANNFSVKDTKLEGDFVCDAKTKSLTGKINNNGFEFSLPKTKSALSIPKLEIEIADQNIVIKENEILFNDKSKIRYSGEVLNYNKLEKIVFNAEGSVNTDDLIKLIGREFKMYVNSRGDIPVKLTINGNKRKQTISAQAIADKDNFITPVEFTELGGKQTSLQAIADLKPGRIKIKKTGLFTRTVTVDEEGNETINLDSILDIDGTIAGDRINLIKVNMPKNLSGKVFVFPQSAFLAEKSRLFVFGETSSPIIRGGINIREIVIPELLMTLDNINLNFRGHDLDFNLKDIVLNGSDLSLRGTLSLLKDSVINISGFDVTSRLINLEKILITAERAQKYVPATSGSGSTAGNTADIPITVHSGSIDMKRIVTGNIEVLNTLSRLALRRNILALNNLRTNIFKGHVNGDINVDLIKTLVAVDLQGEDIDVEKTLLDAAGMKDMLSGTAKFDAKLTIDGTAATPEEQMKGIAGDVNFLVTNGQFGPFGKIENLIIAENIRESQFFQTALGGIINSLTSIDTTHFAELKGHLNFEDGICHIDPITSLGNILSLHIFGDFDLVRNYADMKVRARMASIISQLLGPLNAINPINLMNSAASMNVVTAKAFSLFCEVIPQDEMDMLPNFANKYVDSGAAKFQLKVRGDAAKPLTLVKSFKWLSSKTAYDEAMDFVNSLPDPVEGSTATNIEEAIAEAKALEAEKKTVKYKLKHLFDKKEKSQNSQEVIQDEIETTGDIEKTTEE